MDISYALCVVSDAGHDYIALNVHMICTNNVWLYSQDNTDDNSDDGCQGDSGQDMIFRQVGEETLLLVFTFYITMVRFLF